MVEGTALSNGYGLHNWAWKAEKPDTALLVIAGASEVMLCLIAAQGELLSTMGPSYLMFYRLLYVEAAKSNPWGGTSLRRDASTSVIGCFTAALSCNIFTT